MLHTRNVTTGQGPFLLPGRCAISPTTRRAPTRLSRRADQVGMQRLSILELFGLSSRSCCSTGRLMRSWFINGEFSGSEALIFFRRARFQRRRWLQFGRGGGGPGPRGRSTTNGPRPRDPGRKFANKIYLQCDSWRVVFPSCKTVSRAVTVVTCPENISR
jgi:hypothetical protein